MHVFRRRYRCLFRERGVFNEYDSFSPWLHKQCELVNNGTGASITSMRPTVKTHNTRPNPPLCCRVRLRDSKTTCSSFARSFVTTGHYKYNTVSALRHFSDVSSSHSQSRSLAWKIGDYGNNDKLQLLEGQRPSITKPNEVLIEVHATSVNPFDIKTRDGYGTALLNKARGVRSGEEFPLTLGRDCSGVVIAIGKGVKEFKVEDQVWASINAKKPGCHAQYVVATVDEVSHKPKNISHIEAASIPYVATTNWSAAYAVAKFRPDNALGKRALIFGGSGGIGTFGIQLLKAWGANVTVTCNANSFDLVYELGAHHAVDYRSPDIVKDLLERGKYDYIMNAVGDSMEDVAAKVIKERAYAQYVTLVTPFLTEVDQKGLFLGGLSSSMDLFKRSRKFASVGGKFRWAFAQPNGFALNKVMKLVESGEIKPVIDEVFDFSNLPQAFEKVEKGHCKGKVVVDVAGEKSSSVDDSTLPQLFHDGKD